MANFFTENEDILFHFNRLAIDDIIKIRENDFTEKEQYPYAPESVKDAMDSYRKVLTMVGELTADFIAPRSVDNDLEGSTFDNGKVSYAKGIRESLDMIQKADLMGITIARKYGGLNFPHSISAVFLEMISQADASLMNIVGLQDIAETVEKYADDEIKEKYLPMFCNGEGTCAMVLTEPEAGSDLQAVQLKAVEDTENGYWRLNGVKRFITNGCGEMLLVLARSEENIKDGRGLSFFFCENDDTVKIRRIENKLGIKASPTCEIQFNNTKAYLIGKRKYGLIKYTMSMMNGARVGISLQSLGIAQAAYNEALKYANEREQFGSKIIEFPAVYDIILKMKMDIETTRSLCYHTAWAVDMLECLERKFESITEPTEEKKQLRGEIKRFEKLLGVLTPLSKYYSSEMCNRAAYDAIQVHGGTGFMKEFNVERHYRDARITSIYEGTSQLQVIAAIGGIVTGVLHEEFDNFSSQECGDGLTPYLEKLNELYGKYKSAVDYIREKKDPDYHDLYARKMVDIAVDLYRGYLLLDEAKESEKKKALLEIYINDIYPRVIANELAITSGDESIIKNRDVLLK